MNTFAVRKNETNEVLFTFHHATFFIKGELLFFDADNNIVGMHALCDGSAGLICYGEGLVHTVSGLSVRITANES